MRKGSFALLIVVLAGLALVFPAQEAQAHGGWAWGPAAFAGGLLLGSLARPWYAPPPVYVYPPPAVYPPQPAYVYVPNQAYAYPDPSISQPARRAGGQWIQVPGQFVGDMWVPAHKAWAPAQ
jgi:hypothetical protein